MNMHFLQKPCSLLQIRLVLYSAYIVANKDPFNHLRRWRMNSVKSLNKKKVFVRSVESRAVSEDLDEG